jgi:LmbE family N-acetylglucosaminyl deacetylase
VSVAAGADRHIHGRGTAESSWRRWPGWAAGRRRVLAELAPGGARVVVVAPHPDDETLAAGGLLHDAARAGHPTAVIAVTAGGASHPGSGRWPAVRLADQRRAEREAALAALGAAGTEVVELGVPDGAVSRHADEVSARVGELLRPADLVVTVWRYDGHPDHEATAAAVLAAGSARDLPVLQAPVWGWHWADPTGRQLPSDVLLYHLDSRTREAKQTAIGCFTSQLQADPTTGAGPVLPDWALPRWQRDTEVYLDA